MSEITRPDEPVCDRHALLTHTAAAVALGLVTNEIVAQATNPNVALPNLYPGHAGRQFRAILRHENEHVAFIAMTKTPEYADLALRSKTLAVYALTGFANFASVGIQLGGIGAMAEGRRADLARLGMRALFVGFTATLVNAAVAGLLL